MPDEIFDLDAIAAEANETPFQFRFDGEVYECPPDLSIDVIENIESGNVLAALELLLGSEQWARLRASKKVFGVTTVKRVLDEYAKHLGIPLPNSSGSTA